MKKDILEQPLNEVVQDILDGESKTKEGEKDTLKAKQPLHYNTKIDPYMYCFVNNLEFLEGNIIKYITRAGKKDNNSRLEDLEKAHNTLHRLILEVKNKEE